MKSFRFAALTLVLLAIQAIAVNASRASTLCRPAPALVPDPLPRDVEAEQAFCAIHLNDASVAVCPKTWSTSPGALVYDLEGTDWQGRASDFERNVCAIGGRARDKARSELAIFKNSLNGRDTSGTFAPSSVLYYHFSRLLQTRIEVPVAVFAELPAQKYRERVVRPGLTYSDSAKTRMLHAGWVEMAQALLQPAAYSHRREMLTADNESLWGVFLLQEGRRYGPEINGTRASGWGDGQNRDFQQTAPFLALREDKPLAEAIAAGLTRAREDQKMASALPENTSSAQIAWWMNEITELVILDTILAQQDRIGNIDYRRRWLWREGETLHSSPTRPDQSGSIQLRTSILNDNDAGVRSGYANYARRTAMLDDWRHMDPSLFKRVQALAADFRDGGPVASAVRDNYRLSRREAQGIIDRGLEVAGQLMADCRAGKLRFDLHLEALLEPSQAEERALDCDQVASGIATPSHGRH
jgi:hypothetical protein